MKIYKLKTDSYNGPFLKDLSFRGIVYESVLNIGFNYSLIIPSDLIKTFLSEHMRCAEFRALYGCWAHRNNFHKFL